MAIFVRRRAAQHLAERVIPSDVLNLPTPSEHDAKKELLIRAAQSYGLGTAADLTDYHRLTHTRLMLKELVEEGRLIETSIDGWKQTAYLHPEAKVPRSIGARALLSPFDPVVWFRDRAERLFGFHYRIEIYVPKPKRQYGYYVLPFLLGENRAPPAGGYSRTAACGPCRPGHELEACRADQRGPG